MEATQAINPSDISLPTIRNLFFNQIKNLGKSKVREEEVKHELDFFDLQFSDKWIY